MLIFMSLSPLFCLDPQPPSIPYFTVSWTIIYRRRTTNSYMVTNDLTLVEKGVVLKATLCFKRVGPKPPPPPSRNATKED